MPRPPLQYHAAAESLVGPKHFGRAAVPSSSLTGTAPLILKLVRFSHSPHMEILTVCSCRVGKLTAAVAWSAAPQMLESCPSVEQPDSHLHRQMKIVNQGAHDTSRAARAGLEFTR